MARYSGAHPIVDLVPSIPQHVRVRGTSLLEEQARVGRARADLPPPMTPVNGVPIVAWESKVPDTPNPPLTIIMDPIAPRASDEVWGAQPMQSPISVLPEEYMEPIDPPTGLPGIEGFLEALQD